MIFDIQRFSIHDGPGIRTLVFLKGCSLLCKWCSNPESQPLHPSLFYTAQKCLGVKSCGQCIAACPVEAISEADGKIRVDRARCTICSKCQEVCYTEALRLAGHEVSVREVMEEALKDAIFYRHSGGGVTLSGGEPLSQPDFSLALLRAFKEEGLHTAVETCGFAPWPLLESIIPYTDVLLYDFKHMEAEKHRAFTGQDNALILENARRAAKAAPEHGVEMIARVPVVPGFNSSPQEMRAIGEFAREIGLLEIHLLPYHRWGVSKYQRLGLEYELEGLRPPSDGKMEALKDLLEGLGLKTRIGG